MHLEQRGVAAGLDVGCIQAKVFHGQADGLGIAFQFQVAAKGRFVQTGFESIPLEGRSAFGYS